MKVLLADDHSIVRTGLRKILETYPSIEEVFECSNGREALDFIRQHKPDIAILDISMPEMTGLEVLEKVNEGNLKVKCLMLSMYPEREYALRAIRGGAYGYLTKNMDDDDLQAAISRIQQGKKYISADLQDILLDYTANPVEQDPHEKLSDQEFKVMILLAEGKSMIEIGEKLFISNKTVSTYKTRLLEKMEMSSIAELTRYAISHKLIS